jgi:hypothetical protein
MARITVFADEAGNFDFSLNARASRYFILTTVRLEDCKVGDALLTLRRQLAWEGAELHPDGFHASEDKQAVRDQVFSALDDADFRIDATILDKRKAEPRLAQSEAAFYQLAWDLHLKFVAPRVARRRMSYSSSPHRLAQRRSAPCSSRHSTPPWCRRRQHLHGGLLTGRPQQIRAFGWPITAVGRFSLSGSVGMNDPMC